MVLERQMINLPEPKKQELRRVLEDEELKIQKESRKKICPGDFESLAVIGRGAFGEVRLVRRKGKKEDPATGQIFALKGMKKEMMVLKNQVHHVKAERDALAQADASNQWLTVLHYSFFDESHLYMAMDFMPGGDLMSLLIKEDTFSESVTRFFMAEAAQAISSVHALGYVHRDIKPDNMLLDHRGHLKLTDLGLCKKVGEPSPEDEPEIVLEMLRRQALSDDGDMHMKDYLPVGSEAGTTNRHRSPDDAMTMSIDDTPGVRRDAKTRREVRNANFGFWALPYSTRHRFHTLISIPCPLVVYRWPTLPSVLPTTSPRKSWPLRTAHQATVTRARSTGGRSVSSCLSVWVGILYRTYCSLVSFSRFLGVALAHCWCCLLLLVRLFSTSFLSRLHSILRRRSSNNVP